MCLCAYETPPPLHHMRCDLWDGAVCGTCLMIIYKAHTDTNRVQEILISPSRNCLRTVGFEYRWCIRFRRQLPLITEFFSHAVRHTNSTNCLSFTLKILELLCCRDVRSKYNTTAVPKLHCNAPKTPWALSKDTIARKKIFTIYCNYFFNFKLNFINLKFTVWLLDRFLFYFDLFCSIKL